mmetsp:Transcript_26447/g.71740  ORF Transcript_26447/g.71740 Transcript_26447/m.71740 type:complete len:352 (-) Transcript_26447:13-1068(-)
MITRQKATTLQSVVARSADQGSTPRRIRTMWQSGARSPRPVWPTAPNSDTSKATLCTATEAPMQPATRTKRWTAHIGTRRRPPCPAACLSLALPSPSKPFTRLIQWARICEAGRSCRGKVTTTEMATKTLAKCMKTFSTPVVCDAKKAMIEPSTSPRKAMPHVNVMLRKVATRKADASTTILGNASGFFISFSTGSTMPRPSNEKKMLAASITESATGRTGKAAAAKPLDPSFASLLQPAAVPPTTVIIMATLPSLLRPPSCLTSRSRAMAPKRSATKGMTRFWPRPRSSSSANPATKSTKQQHTPPCTMKTKTSATLRPTVPRAFCTTSPRPWMPGCARARLHSVSTSIV